MIARIDLHHFKCFKTLKLPLRDLTILSGSNASGKSTVMQALVLLHQTMREHEWSSRLMLNGSTIRLGMASDVIDQVHGRNICGIKLFEDDNSIFAWQFQGQKSEMSMRLHKVVVKAADVDNSWDADNSTPLHYLLPHAEKSFALSETLRGMTYLTAERLGPRDLYQFDDPQLTPVVGPQGQYAVSLLHSNRDNQVLEQLVKQTAAPTVYRQAEEWMSSFFPNCILQIDELRRLNALTLGIRISKDTDFLRPIHTGFGLTQVLPIIVASLTADSGSLLLIENPEVHLHPAAQSRMGNFLARVASAGVQVLVETHSDHVLNGIRKAVKSGVLNNKKLALHFFRNRSEEGEQVESPSISSEGKIDRWPVGFFDQFDHDLNDLLDWD